MKAKWCATFSHYSVCFWELPSLLSSTLNVPCKGRGGPTSALCSTAGCWTISCVTWQRSASALDWPRGLSPEDQPHQVAGNLLSVLYYMRACWQPFFNAQVLSRSTVNTSVCWHLFLYIRLQCLLALTISPPCEEERLMWAWHSRPTDQSSPLIHSQTCLWASTPHIYVCMYT